MPHIEPVFADHRAEVANELPEVPLRKTGIGYPIEQGKQIAPVANVATLAQQDIFKTAARALWGALM